MLQTQRKVKPNEAATGDNADGEALEVPQIEDALKAAEAEQQRAAGETAAKALADELAREAARTKRSEAAKKGWETRNREREPRIGGCGCGGW